MANLSDRTRKILWARSGNRCAYCKCLLVLDNNPHDDESIIGEECHIVADKERGARGISDKNSEERDQYLNLILLCRNHHKMVDDQRETYTVQILTNLKVDHEKWIQDSLEPITKARKSIQFIRLPLISDAKEIVQIISSASSQHTDYPTPETEQELSLIKDFVGEFEGLSILSDDLIYMADATFRIRGIFQELRISGFYIYGKVSKGKLSLKNNEEMDWKHGFVVLKKFRVPEITVGYDPNFQF